MQLSSWVKFAGILNLVSCYGYSKYRFRLGWVKDFSIGIPNLLMPFITVLSYPLAIPQSDQDQWQNNV